MHALMTYAPIFIKVYKYNMLNSTESSVFEREKKMKKRDDYHSKSCDIFWRINNN